MSDANNRKPGLQSQDLYSAEPARGWMPWGALAPFLALAFVIATALAGDWLISPFVRMSPEGNPLDPAALIAFTLVPFGLLLVVLLGWVRFVERRPLASLGIRGELPFREFLRGHAIGMAGLFGIVMVIWMFGGLRLTAVSPALLQPISLVPIALLLFTFALQASVEELLVRGWLLSVLAKKFNVPIALFVSSALFSLLHFNPRTHWLVSVGTFLFALFACAWVLRTRSLLGIMGWHAGWNWLLAIGFGLPVTGIDVGLPALLLDMKAAGPDWLTGGAQGPEASVVCFGYFILGIVWMWRRRGNSGIAYETRG
jgi:membrane protease YdiL (CAAX protease family)